MRTYANFKNHDKKRHRLSIFAEDNEEEKILHITVIPCSRDDQFSRKEGRRLYEELKMGGKVYHFKYDLKYESHPKNEFLDHCYYEYYSQIVSYAPVNMKYRKGAWIDERIIKQ